jgi:cytochrome c biogenesis protein CcdA
MLVFVSGRQITAGQEVGNNDKQLQEPVSIIFFSAASCEDCLEVKETIPELIVDLEEYISIEVYDIETDPANLALFLTYCEEYETPNVAPPVIFVGDKYLIGTEDIIDNLQEAIKGEMDGTILPPENTTTHPPENTTTTEIDPPKPEPNLPPKEADKTESKIVEQFNKFSIGAIILAGLIDGINPCAFTTIIFFISMLAYLGKSKYQLVVVGVGFTVSVFVTYLLLGLGLLGAAKSFLVSHGVSRIATYIVAGLTFVLAGWSFVDFINFISTKSAKSMTLGLPKSIKTKIHKVIRDGIGTRGLVAGSLSVGAFVAVLESICTGQVYLPVIIFVAKSSELKMTAISYLVLYNLMFILPLVIVLIITYFGVKSESLGNFFGRHLAASKLIMTLLFLGLGILLLVT